MKPIFGQTNATSKLLSLLEKISRSNANILITGESGSGKEVVATEIHRRSDRKNGAFVAINCGAIPQDLLESELFGHSKGAFTGAFSQKKGKFELATGGSIFLDEIGDMPLNMQVKLLRVIQEQTINPLGSDRGIPIDVRIIAATHKKLETEIVEGRFREDLYFRLNVIPLTVPPLRERAEELPDLVSHFANNYAEDGVPISLTKNFLIQLQNYSWPGNIRELSNFIQRLSVLHPGQTLEIGNIDPTMLPPAMSQMVPTDNMEQAADIETDLGDLHEILACARGISPLGSSATSMKDKLDLVEQLMITRALEESSGNVSLAAKLLRVNRTTLIDRLKRYRLQ